MLNPEFKYQYYSTNVGFFFRRHAASYDNNLNGIHSVNDVRSSDIVSMNGWWKLDEPINKVFFTVHGTRKRVGWKLADTVPFAVTKALKNLAEDNEIEIIKTKTEKNTQRHNYKRSV